MSRYESLALTIGGAVEFLRGRTQSGHAVSALARMFNSFLPSDRPTQLRLLMSTAGPDSLAYKSVAEFVEALKYFEGPGRRNVLFGIHERALTASVRAKNYKPRRSDSTPNKKGQARLRRPLLVPAFVLVLLAEVAGGASRMKRTQPGSIV